MQPLTAPVGGGEKRHLDVLERDHPGTIEVVDQPALGDLAGNVDAVLGKLMRLQVARSRYRLAGDLAHRALVADAMLHAQHLARVPARGEPAENAAVAGELAVVVGEALPDAERGKMWRFQRRHLPLVGGEIGDAVDADLAVRPG